MRLIAGLSSFELFNALSAVIASIDSGTRCAPVSGLLISAGIGVCGLYAASAIGLVRRPPLQRTGLAAMATVCIVRALLLPVLAVGHPELRNTFEIVAAIVWGLAGIGLACAFVLAMKQPKLMASRPVRQAA